MSRCVGVEKEQRRPGLGPVPVPIVIVRPTDGLLRQVLLLLAAFERIDRHRAERPALRNQNCRGGCGASLGQLDNLRDLCYSAVVVGVATQNDSHLAVGLDGLAIPLRHSHSNRPIAVGVDAAAVNFQRQVSFELRPRWELELGSIRRPQCGA